MRGERPPDRPATFRRKSMGFECRDALCTLRTDVPVAGFTPAEDVRCSRYLNALKKIPDSQSSSEADLDLYKRCAVAYDFAGALSNGCSLFSEKAEAGRCEERRREKVVELGDYLGVLLVLSSALVISLAATGMSLGSLLFGNARTADEDRDRHL